MPYLTLDDYKERSTFDADELAEFFGRPSRANTFVKWERALRSRRLDDKLRARYVTPFGVVTEGDEPDPELVPEACKDWLAAYLDDRVLRARRYPGGEPADDSDISADAAEATREIELAADQDRPAHVELPLRATAPGASGVSKGGPLVVTFCTPHGFFDAQADRRDREGW